MVAGRIERMAAAIERAAVARTVMGLAGAASCLGFSATVFGVPEDDATPAILERWRRDKHSVQPQSESLPRLVILAADGGDLRGAIWEHAPERIAVAEALADAGREKSREYAKHNGWTLFDIWLTAEEGLAPEDVEQLTVHEAARLGEWCRLRARAALEGR